MNNDKKKLVIWFPIPESLNWRGEGIAQTIESFVKNLEGVDVTLVINKKVCEELASTDLFRSKVKDFYYINGSGWLTKAKAKSYRVVDLSKFVYPKYGLIFKTIYVISNLKSKYLSYIHWSIKLSFVTILLKHGILFRGQNVWIPSIMIPNAIQIAKKRRVLFWYWDAFSLEFVGFTKMQKNILVTRLSQLKEVINSKKNVLVGSTVITQSAYNKKYLCDVVGILNTFVEVVHLGYENVNNKLPDRYKDAHKNKFLNVLNNLKIERKYKATFLNNLKPYIFSIDDYIKWQSTATVLYRLGMSCKFDNHKLVFVSTQNRPYKGIDILLYQLNIFVSETEYDLYFIFTCDIEKNKLIRYPKLYEKISVLPRLSNADHSVLIKNSDLVIHSSYAEGGLGAYSAYEAASCDVPSLINCGRHTNEMSDYHNMEFYGVCDFTRYDLFKHKLQELLSNEDAKKLTVKQYKSTYIDWRTCCQQFEMKLL